MALSFILIPAFAKRFVNTASPTPLTQTKSHWLQRWMGLTSSFSLLGQETHSVVLRVAYSSYMLPGPFSYACSRAGFLHARQLPIETGTRFLPTAQVGDSKYLQFCLISPYLMSRSQGCTGSKEVVFKLPNSYSFIKAAVKSALYRATEETAIISLDQSPN